MIEEWRHIHGHEAYEVSNIGRVRRGARVLRHGYNAHGHEWVTLSFGRGSGRKPKMHYVHRLVMLAFGPPASGPCVLHWDGNPKNNRLSNLRWGTHTDNYWDSRRHGTAVVGTNHGKHPKGVSNNQSRLTDEDIVEIRARYNRRTCSAPVLAKEFGVSQPTISSIVRRRTWRHVA